jgi:hypothetical protein
MSTSTSSGSSFSNSEPTFLETPENALINQLSGVAAGLAQQMNQWAQAQFAKTSQVTDQTVGNFFQVSQKMLGFSNGLTDQYNNLFAPENAQLIADANSYASPERMAVNMGMAGATQAQAGEAALRNSERDLLSYGIDPSSGRYAALDKAGEIQNAANIAGAENMQRNADVATGQRLRSEAVQVGAQLPAAIANTANTAIQANTGASNASLANANTGANMNRLANEYMKTAMDIKLPPTGQRSTGGSNQSGSSHSPDRNSDGSGGSGGRGQGGQQPGGGGGYGSGGGSPAWMPQHGNGYGNTSGGGGRGTYNTGPGSRFMQFGDGQPDSAGYGMEPYGNPDMFDYLDHEYGFGDISGGYGSVGQQQYDPFEYGGSNPFSDSGFGQEYDYGGANQTFNGIGDDYNNMGMGNLSYDPQANAVDTGWDQTYNDVPAWGGNTSSYQSYDNYGGGGDLFGANYGDGGGYDSYSSENYYAAGGQVQPQAPQSPRMVPPQASPSGGMRQDDVRANVGVGEFIVPEDVARWKGAEFFHNLIAKSRKTRATSGIGGKPMPAGDPRSKGPPTFSTR